MRIKKLRIKNLRCIEDLEFDADRDLNLILGDNAQGKSTILESIFLLCTSKSFRTGHDKELIKTDENVSLVFAEAEREKRNPVKVELALVRNAAKQLKINGLRKRRIPDLFGEINCVVFSAEDTAMLRGEPKARRHYLNLDISQLYPAYAQLYGEYKKILAQRNTMLREISANPDKYPPAFLDVYDEKAASLGAALIEKRLVYTKALFTYAEEFYRSITDSEDAEFSYVSSVKYASGEKQEIEGAMKKQLAEKRASDIIYHTTCCGPHRDDISAVVNGMPAKTYGSAGQQRSCAMALKLAQIYLIYDLTGDYPVVLLDDFASELDKGRQKKALDAAKDNCQCFITATHTEKNVYGKIFSVKGGKLV